MENDTGLEIILYCNKIAKYLDNTEKSDTIII